MTPEQLFSICNYIVLPGWALLLLAPWWRWTTRLISSIIIPVLLSIIYTYLIVTYMNTTDGTYESLEGVARIFENPNLLLAGWVHYLAFDLFVGVWEVQDSRRLGLLHWYIAPCLLFTFLLGPIGLLMYLTIRLILKGAVFMEYPSEDDSEDTE